MAYFRCKKWNKQGHQHARWSLRTRMPCMNLQSSSSQMRAFGREENLSFMSQSTKITTFRYASAHFFCWISTTCIFIFLCLAASHSTLPYQAVASQHQRRGRNLLKPFKAKLNWWPWLGSNQETERRHLGTQLFIYCRPELIDFPFFTSRAVHIIIFSLV